MLEKLKAEIEKQIEKEYEYSTVRCCAAQLLDIIGEDEHSIQIVLEDFAAGRKEKVVLGGE